MKKTSREGQREQMTERSNKGDNGCAEKFMTGQAIRDIHQAQEC